MLSRAQPPSARPDTIEPTITAENKKFVQHLRKVGANAKVDPYDGGTPAEWTGNAKRRILPRRRRVNTTCAF